MKLLLILLAFPIPAFSIDLELDPGESRCIVEERSISVRKTPEGNPVYHGAHGYVLVFREAYCARFEQTQLAAQRAGDGHIIVLNSEKNPYEDGWLTVAPEGAAVSRVDNRLKALERRVKNIEQKLQD